MLDTAVWGTAVGAAHQCSLRRKRHSELSDGHAERVISAPAPTPAPATISPHSDDERSVRVGIGSIGRASLIVPMTATDCTPDGRHSVVIVGVGTVACSARELLVAEKAITTLAIGLVLTAVGSSARERAAV
jgi:hypothetical protein